MVCLAVIAAGIVTASLVSGPAPLQENAEPQPIVQPIPEMPTASQAGAAGAADPRSAPIDPATALDGDVVAEQMAEARTTMPLDPDDASYLREDDVGSHIGEPLDPDDESAMPASGDVSHIGYYLDPLDD